MLSNVPIEFEQGEDFSRSLELRNPDQSPLDISTSTFDGQIRDSNSHALIAQFDCQVVSGKLVYSLTDTQTQAIPANISFSVDGSEKATRNPDYMFDIFRTAGGVRKKIRKGPVKVYPSATEPVV